MIEAMPERTARWHRLRNYIVTGLLIWVPITVTFLVLRLIVNVVDGVLVLLPRSLRPEALLGYRIPGLGILLALIVVLVTGMLFANLVGRRIVALWEGMLGRVPLIGGIFRGSKQIMETVLAPGSKYFRKVVLIHWPNHDSHALAFVTGTSLGEVQARTAEDLISVFLPTTPNPTSGFILFVPRREVVELDMNVDDAFRMIVSLGVVVPRWPRAGEGEPALSRER